MSSLVAPNRRAFLKAGGLTLLLRPTLFGQERRTPANDRIGVAVMGRGGKGGRDMVNFLSQKDVQVVAVCDVEASRRNAAKAKVEEATGGKSCEAVRDFREVLARKDVDAVVIAIGERWHAPMSVLAARAGKDIYCEKPAAMSFQEGQVLVKAVRDNKRVYQCGTQRRSQWAFRYAIDLARDGKLGKLKTLYAHAHPFGWRTDTLPAEPEPDREVLDWDLWLGPSPKLPYSRGLYENWRRVKGLADPGLAEWGGHGADLCQMANRSDESGPVGFRLTDGYVTATYANGVEMKFTQPPGYHPEGAISARFEGEEGWFYVDDGGNIESEPASLAAGYRADRTKSWEDLRNWTNHHRNFLDCVRSRQDPISSVTVAHRAATACHLAVICHLLGREVKWDPAAEKLVGDTAGEEFLKRSLRDPWNVG